MVSEILMIAADHFGFNSETASDNHFQVQSDLSPSEIQSAAQNEFDEAVSALRSLGIIVHVVHSPSTSPDAVFPNNWISFHEQGYVLYPMRSAQRRTEVLPEIDIARFAPERPQLLDMRELHQEEDCLEGTGSLVLDRKNMKAYACLSPRTSLSLLKEWSTRMNYSFTAFRAIDKMSRPIYHTNVLMAIGPSTAIVCTTSITSDEERNRVISVLKEDHQILEISNQQLEKFAGNAIYLQGEKSGYWIMSTTALKSLEAEQLRILEEDGPIISLEVPIIERHGGGSIRCMICELNADDVYSQKAV